MIVRILIIMKWKKIQSEYCAVHSSLVKSCGKAFIVIIDDKCLIYYCDVLFLNRQDSNKELQEIGAANYAVLERIRVNRREDHLKVGLIRK